MAAMEDIMFDYPFYDSAKTAIAHSLVCKDTASCAASEENFIDLVDSCDDYEECGNVIEFWRDQRFGRGTHRVESRWRVVMTVNGNEPWL